MYILILLNLQIVMSHIFIIRHCDKPSNNNNNCCSNDGKIRSKKWNEYFEQYIDNNNVNFFTSDFHFTQVCEKKNNNKYLSNNKCQQSQRMFITAKYIYDEMYNIKNDELININYCTGDEKKLSTHLKTQNNTNKNTIVVWDHLGIIAMLNNYGFNIKKWKHNLNDVYNVVFIIDTELKTLYYDCYDYLQNTRYCSHNIKNWLKNYKQFDQSNESNEPNKLKNQDLKIYKNIKLIEILIIVVVIIIIMTIIIIIHWLQKLTLKSNENMYLLDSNNIQNYYT